MNVQKIRVLAALPLLAIAITAKTSHAQIGEDPELYGHGVTDVLNAVISARAELKSWVLRAKCSLKHRDSDARIGSLLYGVFDGDSKQFRFETKGYTRIMIMSAGAAPPEKTDEPDDSQKTLHKTVSLIVQSRDSMMEWHGLGEPSGHGATCHMELRDCGTQPSLLASAAFNPQAAGLIEFVLQNQMDSVETILKRFALNALSVSLKNPTNSALQVVYEYRNSRRVVHINRENGFTISRVVLTGVNASREETASPRYESSAKWESRSGVWIPVSFSSFHSRADGTIASADCNIDWESVNPDALDDKLFDYRSFKGFWPGLSLIERRNGNMLLLESPKLEDDTDKNEREGRINGTDP